MAILFGNVRCNFRLRFKTVAKTLYTVEIKATATRPNMKSFGRKQPKVQTKRGVHDFTTDAIKSEFEVLATPIKSASDKKDYRVIRLKNGLTACLISDMSNMQCIPSCSDSESELESDSSGSDGESSKSATEPESDEDVKMKKVPSVEHQMAAAALTVGVGSFSDPSDIPGLAHFLEHMVFMGSERFPEENDFDSFIKKRGGSDNASTDCECTTFYFECLEKHLYPSLDKFAQFFIAPLMKEESMTREREAIESEFQMALPSDTSRKEQLLMSLMNPKVPINSFSWGNLKTLKDNLEDKVIYHKLHEFRKRHYSAHRMTLAIQARLPMEALQTYVLDCFSSVPNNNLPPDDFKKYSDVVFDTSAFNRIYYVQPMKNVIELNLTWPLPSLLHMYKSKPLEYVSWLLGDEGRGSLLSYLKQKVWALGIYCGNDESGGEHNSLYSLFKATVILTSDGLDHLSEVIDAVYSYIHLLTQVGPQERIFNEIMLIEETSFRFTENDSPVDYVEDLAEDMQVYPPEDYLCGGQLYFSYDPKAIEMVMSHLTPEKMNVMVLSSTLPQGVSYDKIEPWFNIHYTDVDVPHEWRENWTSVLPYDELALPEPNRFLTSNFSLLSDIDDNPKYPEKIVDTSLMELWYRKDQSFKLPTAYYYYCFISPIFFESPLNACMTDMFVMLLALQLSEEIYPAMNAELTYSMYFGDRGIIVRFDGYNEKLPVLAELVMNYFKNVSKDMKGDVFEAVKETQKKMYYNKFLRPSALAKDIRFSLLLTNHWTSLEKYCAISQVTFDMIRDFSGSLVKNFCIQGLIQGNVSKEVAIATSNKLVDILQCKPLSAHAVPKVRVKKLPQGEHCLRVMSFNKNDSNSIIANYYQAQAFSLRTCVIIEILMMFIEEPLFDILRTKEQLGYHISCTVRDTFGVLGYSITVNAQVRKNTTQHVDLRVESFIRHMNKLLKGMSGKKMNEMKRDLIKLKRCADDNLKEEVDRNWSEITSRDYLFDRLQREIDIIEDVKLAEIKKFWEDSNIFSQKGSPRKLSIQIVGHDIDKGKEPKESGEKPKESGESSAETSDIKEHYSLEVIGAQKGGEKRDKKYFITNIKEFRETLATYPSNMNLNK